MYTWGYIINNCLHKMNMAEDNEKEAISLGFLNMFHIYANEAMTQICSAIKPNHKYFEVEVTKENINSEITMPDDFISFSDDVVAFKEAPIKYGEMVMNNPKWQEAYDDSIEYHGFNTVILNKLGSYKIPYNARWFVFENNLDDNVKLPVPADILDAIPSYIVSQCYRKIDDERNATIFRNEFEAAIARIDDTVYKQNRTFEISGGW